MMMTKIALALTVALGCSIGHASEMNLASEDPALENKTFMSACSGRFLDGIWTTIVTFGAASIKSARTLYHFQGPNTTRTVQLFASKDCTGDVAIATEELGDYGTDPARTEIPDNAKVIDFNFHRLLVTIGSPAGVTIANALPTSGLCSTRDWAVGQTRDMTSHSGEITCYGTQLPRHQANIYRLDDGTNLYFGTQSSGAVDEVRRPHKLDMSDKFTLMP